MHDEYHAYEIVNNLNYKVVNNLSFPGVAKLRWEMSVLLIRILIFILKFPNPVIPGHFSH